MAEHLEIAEGTKQDKYAVLYKQLKALREIEKDPIAVMANAASMIHYTFEFLWTGFYIVKDGMLVVGPFQGPLACNRIQYGRGVCGSAWKAGRTIIVEDVDKFPGHIACSRKSKSEIVVPVRIDGEIRAVIDIDSEKTAAFDDTDAVWLERIATLFTAF